MRHVVHLALCAGLALGLAACARPQGSPNSPADSLGSSGVPSPPAATSGSPVFPPVVIPSGKETAHVERTQSSGEMTLRGVVQDGVESGCHLLRADTGALYLLLGGDVSTIKAGGRIEVVGVPKPLLVTTCQQGTPLQVTSIRPI